MADQHCNEGSSMGSTSGESSDSLTPVSLFKERIAKELGVSVGQQRLIFRGKVLKDDNLLAEYQVENGHTLHLVERQPAQSPPSSDASSGEADGNNSNRGNGAASGVPRNRIGQISHSVVLGTFNVGDQGDGGVPDLSRVIGAVLNSFGVGGQSTTNGTITQSSTTVPQGNETNGGRAAGENQAGIRHSYQPHTSTTNIRDQPKVALPSDARDLPTPEALSIVIRHAVRLLSSHAIGALSHIAGRLEQERDSSDPTVRGQIQTESVQAGLTMQHLGSLLLELGRTILTLRMGPSPAESSVNPGPAVYISPSGPNPVMVQIFPLQTRSLFSGSQSPSNPLTVGSVGVGNPARHINIHIHPGGTLASVVSAVGNRTSNAEGMQGERGNNGSVRVLPVRGAIAATDQPHATGAMSLAAQSTPTESSLSSVVTELNSRIRNLVSMQGDTQAASGSRQPNNIDSSGAGDYTVAALPANLETEEPKSQPQHVEVSNNNTKSGESSKDASVGTVGSSPSSSGESMVKSEDSSGSVLKSSEDNAKPVPLGLGLGGLERKGQVKPTKSSSTAGDSGASSSYLDQNLSARTTGQKILQSLASRSSSINRLDPSSGNPGVQSSRLSRLQEQTGVGSPDDFRNMLQQLTQSPQIMNTVSQLAQQVDSQDIGNMFSGFGGGQGGIDLSRMFQQMMPIVTQALGHGPSVRPPFPAVEPKLQDIENMAQRIVQSNQPGNVFHAVAENAVQVYGNGRNAEELLIELCGKGLAKEYTDATAGPTSKISG
ncbi:Ubiquitin-like superfamily protein, putative isoform 2 [Hibiscus syriacus]|uniref:Ubiquitin-like superfamily protein, putative isoform 2 n=1 Tax=Hibiscus syriacus TaxID=106335 RepID=A0A6A3AFB8_HIBSY|nr:Ubiquitin-like superfamily protein, putative isoform 2 [Hibiscus syriacus]